MAYVGFHMPACDNHGMTTIEFPLQSDCIALYQLLKLTGVSSSGGSAKLTVAEGAVCVDGEVETRKACKIRAGQEVQLGDALIRVISA